MMMGTINNNDRRSFYQCYLLDDSKVESSSNEDSVEQLITEEINLIRMRRHLKWKRRCAIFRNPNGLWCDVSKTFVHPDPRTFT
jgi:hypothetical protein